MQIFIQVFPLGWFQEIFIGHGLSFTSECNCGIHNSNLRTTILRAVPSFWKIISWSFCSSISNSSCNSGSSLSVRLSKKEYLFKGIMVLTIKPPGDRRALARIARFVALPSVTVVSLESRYQNWFFATLLEKSSEKSSRFLMKIPLWILSASYSFFPAELSFKLLINEKEPLIGADSVPPPMLAPFALASNLKSTRK